MKRLSILVLLGSCAACAGEKSDGSGGGDDGAGAGGTSGANTGGAANATSGGAGGDQMAGEGGGEQGGASGSGASGEGGSAGSAGSGGTTDYVPLPPGSREFDGIVNLVDAAAAAELDAFILNSMGIPFREGALTLGLNLFLERYVEEYDFVYLVNDHPLDTPVVGRFQVVTKLASPGIGHDFDWEREGYKTDGTVGAAIGIQFNEGWYAPLGHEIMHYWANNLDPSFGFGLAEDGYSHWGYAGVHGLLGGFDPATLRCETPSGAMPPACATGAGGRTRYTVGLFHVNDNGVATPAGPFELYLMGVIPRAQAPTSIVVLDEGEALYDTYDETTGNIVVEAAGMRTVALSDIVARHGTVRELGANERAWRAAFVVISATPASDTVLTQVAEWAKIHGNRTADPDILSFEALTGGRVTLDTRLGPRRAAADPPPAVRIPFGCDYFEQDCGAGKACFFSGAKGTCGFAGSGMRDAPCETSYECAPGFDCAPNQAGTASACEPFCNPDQTAADACGTMCPWFILTDENDVTVAGICQAP